MATKQVFNTSAELDYPTVLPTLDLDFANTKTLDPRITFTRASGGSYTGADGLIKYAGLNEARFDHDPVTGESLGLLVEEARTNLIRRSEEFTLGNPWFYSASSSITLNSGISPDGKNTAAKWSFDTQTLQRINGASVTVSANTNHTFSIYLKSAGLKYIAVYYGKSGSPFTRFGLNVNLLDGTFSNIDVSGPTSASIRKVDYFGDGWYRVQIGGIFDTISTDGYVELRTRNNDGTSEILVGDGVSGYYIWGAQLEQGAFPTSYIPTQGSTRTRAADSASITGKNFSDFYNRTESSIFVEYLMKGNFGRDGFNRVYEVSDGGSNRFTVLKLGSSSSSIWEAFSHPNNINDITYNPAPTNYGIFYKNVVAFKENDFIRYTIDSTNTLRGNIDSTFSISKLSANQLNIGYEAISNIRQLDGYIRRLTYYPKRLPNSQLQSLTL